ncbi:MAG: hypothetical protein ACRC4T_08235 [Cetobacterium sp.]
METTKLMKLLNEAEGSFYKRNRERANNIRILNEVGNRVILEIVSQTKTEKVSYTLNEGRIENEEVLKRGKV